VAAQRDAGDSAGFAAAPAAGPAYAVAAACAALLIIGFLAIVPTTFLMPPHAFLPNALTFSQTLRKRPNAILCFNSITSNL
jgi:hypothetical protein